MEKCYVRTANRPMSYGGDFRMEDWSPFPPLDNHRSKFYKFMQFINDPPCWDALCFGVLWNLSKGYLEFSLRHVNAKKYGTWAEENLGTPAPDLDEMLEIWNRIFDLISDPRHIQLVWVSQ